TTVRERRAARCRGAPARRAPAPQRGPARDPEARRLAGRAPARLSAAPPWPLAGGVRPMTSSEAVAKALLLKRDGAVLLITLNRRERGNAVNGQMGRERRGAFIGARPAAGPARRGGDGQGRALLCRPGPGRDDGRGRPGVRRPDGRAVRVRQAA